MKDETSVRSVSKTSTTSGFLYMHHESIYSFAFDSCARFASLRFTPLSQSERRFCAKDENEKSGVAIASASCVASSIVWLPPSPACESGQRRPLMRDQVLTTIGMACAASPMSATPCGSDEMSSSDRVIERMSHV